MKKWFLTSLCSLIFSISFAQFNPNPCVSGTAYHIVVIGSSTAAGAGPSSRDSAWVWRYRRHLQSINPANQVTNLAVGGFVTYRLMPDNFVPPPNRPLPDTAHNITMALSLNPDAIIVNLPSNDRQYPMHEQLDNFDSLYRHSNANGVPMWICTTQPIGSTSAAAYQMAVRDSIFTQYGNFAIDFWTTIADTATGTVHPLYDADGIHLNDSGHRILFQRVVNADILTQIHTPLATPEISLSWIGDPEVSACGDSITPIHVGVTNLGTATLNAFDLDFSYLNIQNPAQTGTATISLPGGLTSCNTDTLTFFLNTYDGGDFQLTANHTFADQNTSNDTVQNQLIYTGHPSITATGGSGCTNTHIILSAMAPPGDTILWYDQPAGGSPLGGGTTFSTPSISTTTSYYAEAVRGNLFYENSLTTTTTSNVNWNGIMFNLIGGDAIVVDSFSMKINTLGLQGVEMFYKAGSYMGHEATPLSWTFLGRDTVLVTDPDAFATFHPGGFSINPGDTVGIYVRMENSSSRLSYQSAGSTLSVSTPELEVFTGSGIGYNFNGDFFPRQWNGTVHYHYGSRPGGDCHTDRVPVVATINLPPSIDLGTDTVICESFQLAAPAGYSQYLWSTGDTSQSISIDESGVYWAEVNNACGNAIDAISVEVDSVPVADFDYLKSSTTIGFQNLSVGARSYFWDFGDGNTSTQANPVHNYISFKLFTVTMIVTNACGSDTTTTMIPVFSTSVDPANGESAISLFPNPTTNSSFLLWENAPKHIPVVTVFDMLGKEVPGFTSNKISETKWSINLQDIPSGIYWIKVQTPERQSLFKLAKN